jgi:DEAD/DEAH box helicase domain-containing protein
MLPSLLARDIQQGIKQFLITGFEPGDGFFHGVMRRFVDNEPAWMKGPYLQVGLPFRHDSAGRDFFSGFQTERPAYTHQRQAWQRLASNRLAAHTLVATGTGSGKTECFVYPALDHCARARQAGEGGIKALVIYPMNALAMDQARRFAHFIVSTPAFHGLRVGLFVGGNTGAPGSGMLMTTDSVITDRDTMRQHPPDILLTNYKMLDYLLIRPRDRQLWDHNGPTTLRYVVVDELHTFDGAQGTDLALLLRRLQARLHTPAGHLICAGTSATLGDTADTAPLREYARQVFGVPFDEHAVITENRLSATEFLGDAAIEHVLQPHADLGTVLDPAQHTSPEAALAAWMPVFFPEVPVPADVRDIEFRVALGELLKRHLLFANLIRLLKGRVISLQELHQQMQGPLPESARAHIRLVLDALLALVAWALARDEQGRHVPLVTLRLQVWMRELRRMVGKVTADPAQVALHADKDLKARPNGLYLPLIQCSECHTTGWLSRLAPASRKLSSRLDEIYNTWFSERSEAMRLYAGVAWRRPYVEGVSQHVCCACGNLQSNPGGCQACGHDELVAVFRTTGTRSRTRGTTTLTWHDSTCPACGQRDRQVLLGARNATLGAQVVAESWASPFNDDKKLIAFSDSVQDAAHRAGFFGARTYTNTVRTAMARAIDSLATPSLPWDDFLQRFEQLWHQPGSPLSMDRERFVAEFIAPNMTWQRDWVQELLVHGAVPAASPLPERVQKRLAWQAVAEFTYLSHRGRNLERMGKAALAPRTALVAQAAQQLIPRLHESLGLRGLSEATVFQWLWGWLTHLRQRGGVMHPELTTLARDGTIWALVNTAGRHDWMPGLGERTPRPVFLSLGQHPDFDRLTSPRGTTWWERWMETVLGRDVLLPTHSCEPLYRTAIEVAEAVGLCVRTASSRGDAIALAPAALDLHTHTRRLQATAGRRTLIVPAEVAERLMGMPCLDAPQDHYVEAVEALGWWATRFSQGDLRRVIAAEHTGLLGREEREELERRFKAREPQPWYENLLSATPTLEMGVDIGALSSVLLCAVPPNQASFVQRIGRAGRRDGNAMTTTLADGNSPHDLYFFEQTQEMLAGEVTPPGVFLRAAEVLRRQLFAFCLDDWVGSGVPVTALPDDTSRALDALARKDPSRFPFTFLDHVLTNEPALLQAFLDLLGMDLDAQTQQRLRDFMRGTDEVDSLRVRLSKALEELLKERQVYQKRALQLKKQIDTLKARPQDEATQHEIDNLQRERQSTLGLISEINQRELLRVLTDAGLIPNYAFPEAGIELKSVLWRRRTAEDRGEGRYLALPAIKYERPAASALSEFAPENRFYANQRRVEVDQINMALASLETWCLCPSCHHMQNLMVQADAHVACPRCGDPMWCDQAQRRELLRFRQAIANSDDTRVRIDDSAEDREPRYYLRQLLVDFEAAEVREAWQLKARDLPFGFEFIARATFRDVNFGELGKPGADFKVANRESSRPGFRLCRHCGKVQGSPRQTEDGEPEQAHAFDCDKRDAHDAATIVDCLYLYREFSSEALRILVLYTTQGVDEEVVQSFIVALQLGLKQRFGGKVDHLRIVTQEEPGRDGGPRREYVLLYDSIPGGTGYLHQLLAQDATTLVEVFKQALEAITRCPCNLEAEKDGCYRCVYQYRQGRVMELVSRDRAREVLTEMLSATDQLERVPTIADIFINPNFDSALEARFIEALRHLSGCESLPTVKLVHDIVKGKSGYLLEVASLRYWIEPQVELADTDGVRVACKPDFVIWPGKAASSRRPIAVFCDGWMYHRNTVREDAQKGSALVASGRFWVWSVTSDDVKAALDDGLRSDLYILLYVDHHDEAYRWAENRKMSINPVTGAMQVGL